MAERGASVRQAYDGVVAAVPVTVPYQRYSPEPAHWWIARALGELVRGAEMIAAERWTGDDHGTTFTAGAPARRRHWQIC